MAPRGNSIAARLRRRFRLGKAAAEPSAPPPTRADPKPARTAGGPPATDGDDRSPTTPLAALRGLGDRPAAPSAGDQAAEAELDTLRGELVRELDRLAGGDDGSGSFRRIAS
jgi:hypothetical protein